jgi:NADH:ubiquinone oxidoreductase subunit 5 (subunit L)/multisubunit Na+/H+ antiporter MnhA subunit
LIERIIKTGKYLFEMSDVALTVVMIVGAITALFMGLLGIVQNDIKKVVAYSTLSQLGYMTVALGVSAYSPKCLIECVVKTGKYLCVIK